MAAGPTVDRHIVERLNVQSIDRVPDSIVLGLFPEDDARFAATGLATALGFLSLLCRSAEARRLVSALITAVRYGKVTPMGLSHPTLELESEHVRALKSTGRLARRLVVRLLGDRAIVDETLAARCLEGGLVEYLVAAVAEGEEPEQLLATNVLVSLMQAPATAFLDKALGLDLAPALLVRWGGHAHDDHMMFTLTINLFQILPVHWHAQALLGVFLSIRDRVVRLGESNRQPV
jgi:hypothetical protein